MRISAGLLGLGNQTPARKVVVIGTIVFLLGLINQSDGKVSAKNIARIFDDGQ